MKFVVLTRKGVGGDRVHINPEMVTALCPSGLAGQRNRGTHIGLISGFSFDVTEDVATVLNLIAEATSE